MCYMSKSLARSGGLCLIKTLLQSRFYISTIPLPGVGFVGVNHISSRQEDRVNSDYCTFFIQFKLHPVINVGSFIFHLIQCGY